MPLDPLPFPMPCSCFCLSLHFFTSSPSPFLFTLSRCAFLAVPASTWRHFSASTLLRPFIHSIVTVRTCTRSSPRQSPSSSPLPLSVLLSLSLHLLESLFVACCTVFNVTLSTYCFVCQTKAKVHMKILAKQTRTVQAEV